MGPRHATGEDGTDRPAPRWLSALPIVAVLILIALGVGLALADHWRRGSAAVGAAAGLAALLRLTLPKRLAGPLVVRSRAFDVVFSALAAALLITAALGVSA